MNLILLHESQLTENGIAQLDTRQSEHAINALKVKIGDSLKIGLVNGQMGTGHVAGIQNQSVKVSVEFHLPPPQALPLKLVLALPRPKAFRRIIQHSVSLGVKEIHLIHAWKVEKSFWQSPLVSDRSISESIQLGLEQAIDTNWPVVTKHPLFKPFVEDKLPQLSQGSTRALADLSGDQHLSTLKNQDTCIVIGPDSGFTPYEVRKLEAEGFERYHIGERTLKVETAVTSAISHLT